MPTEIKNNNELREILSSHDKKQAVLFYGDFSRTSLETLEVIHQLEKDGKMENISFYRVNVGQVRDIHESFNVSNVPTLLVFSEGEPSEMITGRQSKEYYEKSLGHRYRGFPGHEGGQGSPKFPSVTVYSTPTCFYCTKIKDHLRSHGVPFRDIDISRNRRDADDLVRRTGQMGVPQTFIGGTHVMGFDQARIDRLLGLA